MKDETKTSTKAESTKVKIEEIRPHEDDESKSCRTFTIHNEDHTLGNALRLYLRYIHKQF